MNQQPMDDDALAELALAELEGADADTLAAMALAEFEDMVVPSNEESLELSDEALAEMALSEFEEKAAPSNEESLELSDETLAEMALAEFEAAPSNKESVVLSEEALAEIALVEFEDKVVPPAELSDEALAELALAEFEGTDVATTLVNENDEDVTLENRIDTEAKYDQGGSEEEDEVAAMLARIEEMNRMLLSDSKVVDLSKQQSRITENTKIQKAALVSEREPPSAPAMERNEREARKSTMLGMSESGNIAISAMMTNAVDLTPKQTSDVSERLNVPSDKRRLSTVSIASVASVASEMSESSDVAPEIQGQPPTPAGFSATKAFGYFWNRARAPSQPAIPTQLPVDLAIPATPSHADPAQLAERRPSVSRRRSSLLPFVNMFRRSSVSESEKQLPKEPIAQVVESEGLQAGIVDYGRMAELEKMVGQWETRALAAESRVLTLENEVATL